jgi:chemotaxis protein methyltransferase CheR
MTPGAPVLAPLRDDMRDFLLTERDFEKIRALIHKRAGISLGSHKREMVYSRLARRLRALQLATSAPTSRCSKPTSGRRVGVLHQRADHEPDVVLSRGASLSAAGRARQEDRAPYSVWCAAASTGEEPYSIAITLAEALGERAGTVLATDIDTQVLAKARAASTPPSRFRGCRRNGSSASS